jgi:hypothetical protein
MNSGSLKSGAANYAKIFFNLVIPSPDGPAAIWFWPRFAMPSSRIGSKASGMVCQFKCFGQPNVKTPSVYVYGYFDRFGPGISRRICPVPLRSMSISLNWGFFMVKSPEIERCPHF